MYVIASTQLRSRYWCCQEIKARANSRRFHSYLRCFIVYKLRFIMTACIEFDTQYCAYNKGFCSHFLFVSRRKKRFEHETRSFCTRAPVFKGWLAKFTLPRINTQSTRNVKNICLVFDSPIFHLKSY